jgi:hypothetical protein
MFKVLILFTQLVVFAHAYSLFEIANMAHKGHIKSGCKERAKILQYTDPDPFWKNYSVEDIYHACLNTYAKNSSAEIPTPESIKLYIEEVSYGQITKTAKKFGFTQCLSATKSLEKFFTKNKSYGTYTITSSDNTNSNFLNTTIEITYDDGSQIANVSIIPTNYGKCSYTYTLTWVEKGKCTDYAKKALKSFKKDGVLNRDATIYSTNGIRFYLLQGVNECMIQKQEINYSSYDKDK